MPLDTSLVGKPSAHMVFEYEWKDVVLYALGIGAKEDELDYLYEGRGPKTYPSFAVVPSYAPVTALVEQLGGNLAMLVHGAQRVILHAPIPAAAALRSHAVVRAIYDLKRFATVLVDTETTDSAGHKIFDTTWTLVFRGEGGFGGSTPPRDPSPVPPARPADFTHEEATSKEQALLYRLSGDLNPLHASPQFAQSVGFPSPILHGLCTYGFMVRAIVKSACGGDATRLKAFEARFSRPVFPGDTIVTRGWKLEGGDTHAIQVHVRERPDPVINNAWAKLT